jgi:hypothetical protein
MEPNEFDGTYNGPMMSESSSVMHSVPPPDQEKAALKLDVSDIKFPYKETDDVVITSQLAMDYYSSLHLAGNRIQLEWSGGGDSGSVWLNINNKQIDEIWDGDKQTLYDRIHQFVINEMYDNLDYGSWAGEFSASGTADFIIEDGFVGFRGTDSYSQDDYHHVSIEPCTFTIPIALIPEHINEVYVSIQDGYDGSFPEVMISLRAKGDWRRHNDELSAEAAKCIEELEGALAEFFRDLMDKYEADHCYDDQGFSIEDRAKDVELTFNEFTYYTTSDSYRTKEVDLLNSEY